MEWPVHMPKRRWLLDLILVSPLAITISSATLSAVRADDAPETAETTGTPVDPPAGDTSLIEMPPTQEDPATRPMAAAPSGSQPAPCTTAAPNPRNGFNMVPPDPGLD